MASTLAERPPSEEPADWYPLTRTTPAGGWRSTPASGSTRQEVVARRDRYGANKLDEEAPEPAWKAFLRQYRDLMQLVLVGAAVVSILALQDISTGLVVLGITVVNALMGVHQEGKAAASVAALRQMLIITARVRRDGEVVEVPAEELVPGDIVSFEAGDKVPADGRILVAATLEIEEAGLTGESTPVAKSVEPVAGRGRAARRPGRHGVHELPGHPRPRGDAGDGHRHGQRGRAHLRDAQRGRTGEDAAHPTARPAHRADHDHGCRSPGADRRPRPGTRRGVRHLFLVGISLAISAIPTGLPAVVTKLLSVGTQRPGEQGRHRQAAASRSRRSARPRRSAPTRPARSRSTR